jgi:hypothetical protein
LRIDQDQKTHPEVFVHVESHQTVDENLSTVESSPNLPIDRNIGMTPFGAEKQAPSVCSSVDKDLSEKESQDDALRKGIKCNFLMGKSGEGEV